MDLIATITAWVLTFVAGLLGNILAHDLCASANRTCAKIIHKASRRLAWFDCEPVEQEWLADLYERETVREKYQHAIGCFLGAAKMRRQAMAVTIVLGFHVDGVGTIPLSLDLSSKLTQIYFTVGKIRFEWARNAIGTLVTLYLFLKFARSTNALGPGKLSKLGDKLKEYKTWGYEARMKRKGLDIDLSEIFRLMVHNPKEVPSILRKVTEFLDTKPDSTPPA